MLSNIIFGLLLVFTGANVPVDDLPGWMQIVSEGLPFTHGIEAARRLADGGTLADVWGLIGLEALIGVVYGAGRLRAGPGARGHGPPARDARARVARFRPWCVCSRSAGSST